MDPRQDDAQNSGNDDKRPWNPPQLTPIPISDTQGYANHAVDTGASGFTTSTRS